LEYNYNQDFGVLTPPKMAGKSHVSRASYLVVWLSSNFVDAVVVCSIFFSSSIDNIHIIYVYYQSKKKKNVTVLE